jgi:WhiB family redox-sensing transcriptional regulator
MAENLLYRDQDGKLLPDYEVEHWTSYANCGPETAELFFVTDAKENEDEIKAAKRICAACRVASVCLMEAIENGEKFGIWGGKTEKERGHKSSRYNDAPKVQDEVLISPSTEETRELAEETHNEINNPNHLPLAGDWLTVGAIAELIGKGHNWVYARIKEKYIQLGEERMSNNVNRVRVHYPPSVAELIKEEADKDHAIPPTDAYLSIYALAAIIGRDRKWVAKRLPYITSHSETRRNPQNHQSSRYFHPEAVDALLALPLDILNQPVPIRDIEKG